MSDNLKLWDSLEKTDRRYTKPFNRGGFKGDAINGAYILKRLTETFGPCGIGWRFVVDHEDYVSGHVLKEGASAEAVTRTVVHVVRGHLEYIAPARAGEIDPPWYKTGEQYGQTTMVGENKNGIYTDEEAPKKSVTDCIAKCACLLGIGADIHLGQFDDNKWVVGVDPTDVAALVRAADGEPVSVSNPDDTKTFTQKEWQTKIAACQTMNDLALFLDSGPLSPEYDDVSEWEQVCAAAGERYIAIDSFSDGLPEERGAVFALLQAEDARLKALTTPKVEAPTNATTADKPAGKRRGRPPKNATAKP